MKLYPGLPSVLFTLGAFALSVTPAAADVLSQYSFASGSVLSSDADPLSVASSFAATGLSTNYSLYNFARVTSDLTDATRNTGKYWSFSITPTSGAQIGLSSLTFDSAFYGGTTGFVASFAVYSNAGGDNFATLLGTATANSQNTGSPTLSAKTIDLSGAAFQNLTSSVQFRIYPFDNTSSATRQLGGDNFVLNGAATAIPVPEPSSYALIGAGLAALAATSRRRRRA